MKSHTQPILQKRSIIGAIFKNWRLILNLVNREVLGRYKGSIMGLLWSFINPVVMMAVYTFMFSVVFKARWAGGTDSKIEYALVLFAGLLVFNLFSEVVARAPGLIVGNANYVKKVVFPIEILPIVTYGAAVFHLIVSLIVWLIFYLIFFGLPKPTIIFMPLILIPLSLMTLGVSWFLASLGVFLRDVGQIVGLVTMALMFLSPVFYPVSALPTQYQEIMQLNPLTYIVEEARNVMIWGKTVRWSELGWWTIVSWLIATGGFSWFQRTKKGFADVI